MSTSEAKPAIASDGIDRPPVGILVWWLIYASVMVGAAVIFCGRMILTGLSTDSSGLCALLGLLFTVGIIKNLSDVLYVDRELKLAYSQVKELLQINKLTPFLRQAEPSLLKEHMSNLVRISMRDHDVTQDNLVALLQVRLVSRTRLTDVIAGLLVTVGLIGTIVGLISSIGGLGSAMQAVGQDKAELLSGMREVLSGMGTAFYTTLLGSLFGSVILKVLSSVADQAIDELIARIAELSEVYVLPLLRVTARRRSSGSNQNRESDEQS